MCSRRIRFEPEMRIIDVKHLREEKRKCQFTRLIVSSIDVSTTGTARFLFEPFVDTVAMKTMLTDVKCFHRVLLLTIQWFHTDGAGLAFNLDSLDTDL